jgi:hypothetical protein
LSFDAVAISVTTRLSWTFGVEVPAAGKPRSRSMTIVVDGHRVGPEEVG